MIHALRASRYFPKTTTSIPQPPQIPTITSAVRFRPTTAMASEQDDRQNLDKTHNPNEKTGDIMSHSFGEGYATRSDEEGFGGIYGGNQSIPTTEDDDSKTIHENHPEYDRTQGSEVKEKEKGRHQT